jgi:DNA-binding CsgD family transcriptional regulator
MPWDVVEAASRCGQLELARSSFARFLASPQVAGASDATLGWVARCEALLADEDDEAADDAYGRSIAHFERACFARELARARLLYGEWLRRRRRRIEARAELRQASETFERLGMSAFARRAEKELLATGEKARPRRPAGADAPGEALTPQESQIAELASAGLSNREIAGKLFISAATVDYHLRKVYRKLGVSGRFELARVLFAADR